MAPRHLAERGKQEGEIGVVPKRPVVTGCVAVFGARGRRAGIHAALVSSNSKECCVVYTGTRAPLTRVPHWVSPSSDFSEIETTPGIFRNAPHLSSLPTST
ncbi:unnamed protein product [Ixodes hexagonus]